MSATLAIDTSGFRRAIGGLLQFTGLSLRHIIRAEVGSILKACVGDTKVASAQQADLRSRLKLIRGLGLTQAPNKGDVSVNAGWRPAPYGRVWIRTSSQRKFAMARDGSFRLTANRFGPAWQARITAATESVRSQIARWIKAGRRAIGLSRQSWVQIADDAGIALEAVPGGRVSASAIAKARGAIASDGARYPNGQSRQYSSNREFVIELINRLPWGRKIALDAILIKNINARARFFDQNVRRGVFDRLRTIARAYPGLEVRLS